MPNYLKFYLLTNKLKNVIRTGWQQCEVPAERLESVAEHIYGTCMLAIAIDSEYKLGIDLEHTIKMLVCHEFEEIVIGDITIHDKTKKTKVMAEKAIKDVLSPLIKRVSYRLLLDEFNARESEEAKFAYFCDKLENDIQAKIYTTKYDITYDKLPPSVRNKKLASELNNLGFNTVADIFLEHDKLRFLNDYPLFIELINELQIIDLEEI